MAYNPIDLNKIVSVDFPTTDYYKEETQKTQICLHHTVSNPMSANNDIDYWKNQPGRIATHFIIQYDGIPYQCYNSLYWGHHLGLKAEFLKSKGFKDYNIRNDILNKSSIAIEIDNWGGLTLKDNKYYNCYGNTVDTNKIEVIKLDKPFRGFQYFHKYSIVQINTVCELLVLFKNKYKIPLTYNEDMWDVSLPALGGKTGVWTHCSFREDKSDCFPQKELIDALKSLS